MAKGTSKKNKSASKTKKARSGTGTDPGELRQSARSAGAKAKTRKETAARTGETSSAGMPVSVSEVMSPDPVTMLEIATVAEAAERMLKAGADAVVVLNDTTAHPTAIVTCSDIVLRAIAEGRDPAATTLSSVQSEGLVIIDPDAPVDEAVTLMRQRGIRRIPVVDGRDVLGIVTLEGVAAAVEPRATIGAIATQV